VKARCRDRARLPNLSARLPNRANGRLVHDSAGRRALRHAVQRVGVNGVARLVGVTPSTITRLHLGITEAPSVILAAWLEKVIGIDMLAWLAAPDTDPALFASTQRIDRQDEIEAAPRGGGDATMSNDTNTRVPPITSAPLSKPVTVQPPYPAGTKVPNPDAEKRQQNNPAERLPTEPVVIPSPKDLPKSAPLGPSQDPNSAPTAPFLAPKTKGGR
jgi:transcriptional regulator with XRE-family HTH domain